MPKPNAIPENPSAPGSYYSMRTAIQKEMDTAKKAIQYQRALTYWKIGQHIQKHLLKYKDRAAYGQKVFSRLAHDSGIDERTLQQAVRFHTEFPIPNARSEFTWTHYRELLTLPDQKHRQRLVNKIKTKNLTTRELKQTIKSSKATPSEPVVLEFKRGTLYTYQLAAPACISAEQNFQTVDCGFGIWRQVPAPGLTNQEPGTIVKATKTPAGFELAPSTRTKDDLFNFRAVLDYVIDGDTVVLQVNAGFRTWCRQKLRLRGIDAPEMSTPQGEKSKTFLKETLTTAPSVRIKTYRKDKYARYLADIFIGPKNTFINQLLLDTGHAAPYLK